MISNDPSRLKIIPIVDFPCNGLGESTETQPKEWPGSSAPEWTRHSPVDMASGTGPNLWNKKNPNKKTSAAAAAAYETIDEDKTK